MSLSAGQELERLVGIMARLRAEGGCPWDREQDLRSLRPYLVEETFEVLDEMDRVGYGGKWAPFCEELGDLLFQIVFHAQLASELGVFGMGDVAKAISDKIVSRHPHVFGEAKVNGAEQVLENWAKLKAEEKKRKHGHEGSVLDGVPTGAPSLLRAERLTEKASRIGFDWPDLAGVRGKLDEELKELDEAIARGDRDELEHELGDVLFSLANLARFIKTPAEDALRQANRRFTSRFHQIEAGLREENVGFGQASLEQMERHWQRAKEQEKRLPPPRVLPRAAVAELKLAVRDLEGELSFFDRLAPLVGWTRVHRQPVFDGAGMRIRLVERGEGSATLPIELTLEAPSGAAVKAFAEKLAALGVDATDRTAHAVAFSSPSGVRFRYAIAA
jgi:ATP diphosphatase